MPESPSVRSLHGRLAVELRRAYVAEKLAEHVAKVVAEAPPLSPAQRDRIAVLLRGGAAPPGTTTTVRPDLGAQEGNVVRGGAA